jgi:WD40 repeat protein
MAGVRGLRFCSVQPIPFLIGNQQEDALSQASPTLPLRNLGTTYSMAQEVRWLDQDTFAIGRWDGSLTIFTCPERSDGAPTISAAFAAPSSSGVEMICRVLPTLFASSNDSGSIVIWDKASVPFRVDEVRVKRVLRYDPAIGVANDGAVTTIGDARYFVTGHASGFLLVWQVSGVDEFKLLDQIDLRSPEPISSPYALKNIRAVEALTPGRVVTGSEDGDIRVVDVTCGTTLTRVRYNATAQRGINDIDICGNYLAVANCSVGPDDKNLWLFRIDGIDLTLLDSINLKTNAHSTQVFNFCVDQAVVDGQHMLFAATQDGVVWLVALKGGGLGLLGAQNVSTTFGAALSYNPDSRLLAVAGDNLHLFALE